MSEGYPIRKVHHSTYRVRIEVPSVQNAVSHFDPKSTRLIFLAPTHKALYVLKINGDQDGIFEDVLNLTALTESEALSNEW